MSDKKSATEELYSYLDQCPLDDFINIFKNSEMTPDELVNIETTNAKVKDQESKLRMLRQQIEYQVRKHRLQEFRDRV